MCWKNQCCDQDRLPLSVALDAGSVLRRQINALGAEGPFAGLLGNAFEALRNRKCLRQYRTNHRGGDLN